MKKIGLLIKEISGHRIKGLMQESGAIFVIKYSGLCSPDLTMLRKNLKSSRANLFVVKNNVAQRTFKDTAVEFLVKSIEGPCGLIFVKDEPAETSRILYNFSKEHEQLKLEGGCLANKAIEKKDIELMACLPSKEVLRAQLVMALNSPISGLVITLNQVLAKFVYCLEKIRQKKQPN